MRAPSITAKASDLKCGGPRFESACTHSTLQSMFRYHSTTRRSAQMPKQPGVNASHGWENHVRYQSTLFTRFSTTTFVIARINYHFRGNIISFASELRQNGRCSRMPAHDLRQTLRIRSQNYQEKTDVTTNLVPVSGPSTPVPNTGMGCVNKTRV